MLTPDIRNPTGEQRPEPIPGWLGRVSMGVALLFWTFLLYYPFRILLAFAGLILGGGLWPLGGGGGPHWLDWPAQVLRLARVAIVLGVWQLTTPVPEHAPFGASQALRRVVRVFICIEVLTWVLLIVYAVTGDWMLGARTGLGMYFLGVAYTVICLLYLGNLAEGFVWDRVARSFRLLLIGYIVMKAHELPTLLPQLGWLSFAWWFPAAKLLPLCIWVWGLVLLRRFGKRLRLLIEGRCAHCEYILKGLPEPRCPECGRTFVVPSIR